MINHTYDCHPNDVENNSQALDGLRALVVDDDVDNGILIAFILALYGIQVTTVSSAIEALEIIKECQPNILISDIVMPQVNGYSFIRKIRNLNTTLSMIPAIAITALATKDDCDLALASGFNVCLIKPIDPDDLIAKVKKLMYQ
ncbi:response regulator [Tolypothrix campylonemoides VB511288_2]|uniref:Response regulator n=1 Tax=Tolypothrix campylonemoides VB511288_2 TaxID=3232311 RepID=A0ABW8XNP0_9CYAN